MSEDKIDKLYKNYDILSAAEDKSAVRFFSHSNIIPGEKLRFEFLKYFYDNSLPVSLIFLFLFTLEK